MWKKLSFKMAFHVVVILMAITLIAAPIYLKVQKQSYIDSRMDDMNVFYTKLMGYCLATEQQEVNALLEDTMEYAIRIYDEDLELVYNNRKRPLSKKELVEMNNYERDKNAIYTEESGRKEIILQRKTTQEGVSYYVYIRERIDSIDSVIRHTNRNMLVVLSIYILISCIAIIFLNKSVIDRIEQLRDVATKIAQKEYGIRYRGKVKKDEVGALSENINQMADTIQENITALNNYNFLLKEDLNYLTKYEETRKKVLSNVTHELKTPLAIISSQVEMIRLSDDEEKKEKYYNSVLDEIGKMSKMITALLNHSITERELYQGELEEMDLGELISELCQKSRNYIETKKVIFRTEIEKGNILCVEKNHVEHVFHNFLSNAMGHVDVGGEIVVGLKKKEEKIRLSVYNHGKLIKQEQTQDIWKEFFTCGEKQGDKEKGHMGLGLFIVKEIATIEKTECGFNNREDGVEFWFDFRNDTEK